MRFFFRDIIWINTLATWISEKHIPCWVIYLFIYFYWHWFHSSVIITIFLFALLQKKVLFKLLYIFFGSDSQQVYRFCFDVNPSDMVELDARLGDCILHDPLKATSLFQSVCLILEDHSFTCYYVTCYVCNIFLC